MEEICTKQLTQEARRLSHAPSIYPTHLIYNYQLQMGILGNHKSQRDEILATGSPPGPIYKTGFTGPDFRIRKREIWIFRHFFSLFSLLWTSWDLRVTPRMFRYYLIRIRTGKSGFSKIRIFRFFDFLSLKTLQHGCLLTPLDAFCLLLF